MSTSATLPVQRCEDFNPRLAPVAEFLIPFSLFDKWTNVIINANRVDAESLGAACWIGDRKGSPFFAFNVRATGFVVQRGNSRVSLRYPANDTSTSTVVAVDPEATRLVGGGSSGVVLLYNCESGDLLHTLSDTTVADQLDPKATLTSVAVCSRCQYTAFYLNNSISDCNAPQPVTRRRMCPHK